MLKRYLPSLLGLALLLTALTSQVTWGSVLVGGSGWNWGSPNPQGNTLDFIEFSNGVGYAAGESGSLVKTVDDGFNWTGIPTGITADLHTLELIDTDTLVVGGGCSLRRSNDGGKTFSRLAWTASDSSCSADIVGVSFFDKNSGFLLLKSGAVYRTDDGGDSWSSATKITGSEFSAIEMLSSDVALVLVDGSIYRTANGGSSWSQVNSVGVALNSLYFLDANTGYVMGNGSTLLKTVDGGLTWSSEPANTISDTFDFRQLRCSGVNCLLTVNDGRALFKTGDSGATWTEVKPSSQAIYAAGFSTTDKAIAVGDAGATVVSSNAGADWGQIGSSVSGSIFITKAVSESVAVAPVNKGVGNFVKTVDGGRSWSNVAVSTANEIYDVSFLDADHGFALDGQGGLFGTANGGKSWSILDTGTDTFPYRVNAFDSSNILLIGPIGMRLSTDGGQSFSRVSDRTARKATLNSFAADGKVGVAWQEGSRSPLLLTPNAGKSWRQIRLPDTGLHVRYVSFVSSKTGFIVDSVGRIWKTKNAGKRWSRLYGIGTDNIAWLAFENADEGYVVASSFGKDRGGYLMHTTDGGASWQPQFVSSYYLWGVSTFGESAYLADYKANENSRLYFTTNGGNVGAEVSLKITTKTKSITKQNLDRANKRVKISGLLEGAEGGEKVVISVGSKRGSVITEKEAKVASNGRFSLPFRIQGTSYFVARYAGDADHRGVGTKIFTLKVTN